MNESRKIIMAFFLGVILLPALMLVGMASDPMFAQTLLSISSPHLHNRNPSSPTIAYTISGNAGVAGVTLSYGSTLVTADSSGNYSIAVNKNWSGTVTPTKDCYTFSPRSRSYSHVKANQTGQNYTATPNTYAISGNTGVGEVLLSYVDGTNKSVSSNAIGAYLFRVSCNWSGTITPSKTGYTFDPANYSYTSVKSDQSNQNYLANHVPTNIEPSSFSLVENLLNPAEVGTFTTTDLDPNDIHTYSLVETANYPDNLSFQVTGNLLQTKSIFDFESKSVYHIKTQTNDSHNGTYRKEITITVMDVNESPTDIGLEPASIVENSEIGTPIGIFLTEDQDIGDTYTYLLTNGSGCEDNSFFEIDNNRLFIANDISSYDDKPNYSICVRSTDSGSLSYDKNINIDVIPVFQISGSTQITGYKITYSGRYLHHGKPIPWSGSFTTPSQEYEFPVPKTWTGTVTPSKDDYVFVLPLPEDPEQNYREYGNVLTDIPNQNFNAQPIISGNVGVGGAQICYDDNGHKCVVSRANGTFSLSVSYSWYGPITPRKTDYTFLPRELSLPYVTTPISGMEFQAKLNSPSITSPTNNSPVFALQPTFKWKKMVSIKYYKLSIKDISAGSIPMPSRKITCNESPCSYTSPIPLTLGDIHELCIAAQDERGKVSADKCIKFFVGFKFTFPDSSYKSFWREHPGGDWNFSSIGQYIYTTGKANETSSISYNKTFEDFSFEAKLWPSRGISSGLIVRGKPFFTSDNRWKTAYYFQLTPSIRKFKVYKYLNGVVPPGWMTTSIDVPDDVTVNLGSWNTLRVNVRENNLTFYINGKEVYYKEDLKDPIYFGRVGIYMFGTGELKVDNVMLLMPLSR